MPSAFETRVKQFTGLQYYWTMEAGATAAAAGGIPLSYSGGFSANGASLVKQTAASPPASVVFTGGSATTGSLTVPTSAWSVFGWFGMGAAPTAASTLFGLNNNAAISLATNSRISTPANLSERPPEILQNGKVYFLAATFSGSEITMYINGRWARATLYSGSYVTPTTFSINANGLSCRAGHVGVFNRALSSGELYELFLLGYTGTPPVFTDIYDKVQDGIKATAVIDTARGFVGGNTTNGLGWALTSTSPRPSLPKAINGNSSVVAHPDQILGRCASPICGGAIRANEAHIKLADGTSRVIHVACQAIDGVGAQPDIKNIASPTTAQYIRAQTRLIRDGLASKTIKTTGDGVGQGEKGYYLSVNERDHTSGTAATAPQGHFADYTSSAHGNQWWHFYSESVVSAATLQAYYDLPKNSYTSRYVQAVMDFLFAELQRTDKSLVRGDLDDFTWPCLGMAIKLMQPYVDSGKYAYWKTCFTDLSKQMIGEIAVAPGDSPAANRGSAFYNINGNRDLLKMLGLRMAYLVTGDAKWQRAFEMSYRTTVGAGMPAVGAFAAGPTRGSILTVPAPLSSGVAGAQAGDWPSGGGTNQWNAQIDATTGAKFFDLGHTNTEGKPGVPYGFYVQTTPTVTDGSNGAGYLAESHNLTTTPGGDANYSLYQLEILNCMLPWVNYDARFVSMANMILNFMWPYIDFTGGQITTWRIDTFDSSNPPVKTHSAGDPLAPQYQASKAWDVDSIGGTRSYGYPYQQMKSSIIHTVIRRGLRSTPPTGAPPTLPGRSTPYSSNYTLTAAMGRTAWTTFETSQVALLGATNPEPGNWRLMGTWHPSYLLNDPTFTCPITPG